MSGVGDGEMEMGTARISRIAAETNGLSPTDLFVLLDEGPELLEMVVFGKRAVTVVEDNVVAVLDTRTVVTSSVRIVSNVPDDAISRGDDRRPGLTFEIERIRQFVLMSLISVIALHDLGLVAGTERKGVGRRGLRSTRTRSR